MSSTIRTLSVLLTGAAFAGAAPPLFAQDSPGEQAQDDAAEVGDTALDEESSAIVVTGTRRRSVQPVPRGRGHRVCGGDRPFGLPLQRNMRDPRTGEIGAEFRRQFESCFELGGDRNLSSPWRTACGFQVCAAVRGLVCAP